MYEVELTARVAKQFRKYDSALQKRLVKALEKLGQNPYDAGAKKLSGAEDVYRIRVGDYRIVYCVEDDKLLIVVVKLGHRREVYR